MPIVPQMTSQQVQQQGLNVRQTNVQAPSLRLENDSLNNVSAAAQGLIQTAINIEDKAIKSANELADLETNKIANEKESEFMYGKNGVMNLKGKNALSAPDRVKEEYEKAMDEIEAGLANDDQKKSFKKSRLMRRAEIDRQITRHVSSEMMQYDTQETEAYIASERDMALKNFHDTNRVDLAVQNQKTEFIKHAERNGLPEEYVKQKINSLQSSTYSSVISKIADGGDDMAAKRYFEKYKDMLSGEDQQKVAKLLDESTLRGESQRQSDKIWNGSGFDYSTAVAKAEKISDPKLRDETVRRIRQKQDDYMSGIKAREENNFMAASEYIKGAPGVDPKDAMPVSQWESLTLQQQAALRKYSNNPTNNDKVWLDFLDQNPKEMATMSRAEFEQKYWVNFDDGHRSRAETMWKNAVESKGKPSDMKVTNTLTFLNRIDNTLRNSKFIDPNKKKADFNDSEAEMYSKFEQEAARRLEDFEVNELGGKRQATGQEVQKIMDDMVTKKVFVDKGWLWKTPTAKPTFALTDDERPVAYLPIKQIPVKERNAIENLIKHKGKKYSVDKLQRAYAAYVDGKRELFDQIIGE